MGYRTNVDGCVAEIKPTPEDYFLYYPEMKNKMPVKIIIHEINTSELLHTVFLKCCDDNWGKLSPELALEFYVQMLHTFLCKKYLHENVRNGRVLKV